VAVLRERTGDRAGRLAVAREGGAPTVTENEYESPVTLCARATLVVAGSIESTDLDAVRFVRASDGAQGRYVRAARRVATDDAGTRAIAFDVVEATLETGSLTDEDGSLDRWVRAGNRALSGAALPDDQPLTVQLARPERFSYADVRGAEALDPALAAVRWN